MEQIIAKLGSKAPIIIARALARDPFAIATLVGVRGVAALTLIKNAFDS